MTIENITQPIIRSDADRKFILAMTVIAAFIIMLAIPLLTNNSTLFSNVATAMSGLVGTIIGYYFGSEKASESTGTTPK